ncbi:MAG: hypothetical protein DMF84_31235 [Acidobacteria bacterium]|nr:MAG: hypothetical protein DMF84_31235 [Acidobacteriota bacterium]
MGEDQAVTADAGIVADDHRLGRVDGGELQDDRAGPQGETRFGQLRPAHVHLFADLRILAHLDSLARQVAHGPHARVAADPDGLALHNGEESDLHVIPDLHRLSHHDAAEAEADAATDAVAEEEPVRDDLQAARQPTKDRKVAPRNAVLRDERGSHR